MHPIFEQARRLLKFGARNRFALPLLALLTAGILLVSEETYNDTSDALRRGIVLTDARIQSARLLQLLTDAEAAEHGYLLTGDGEFLTRFEQAARELPGVQAEVSRFLGSQPMDSAAAAGIEGAVTAKFVQVERVLALARAGNPAAAAALRGDATSRGRYLALRQSLQQLLASATTVQQGTRVSFFRTLKIGRLTVGVLTLVAFFSIFLLLYQLRRQEKERSEERTRLEVEVQIRTARLTELARHFQSVREDERSNIARELHDELGSLLTVSKLEIARAQKKAGQPDEILASLQRVTESLNKGIALKRRIIEDLTPSALKHFGLGIALENLCHDMSVSLAIPVILTMEAVELSPDAQLAVYRFIQEALTNIGKYAEASHVSVTFTLTTEVVTIAVEDDGVGFDSSDSLHGHHGLSGMRFRAESLGGLMRIDTARGRGTTLRIEFPRVQS